MDNSQSDETAGQDLGESLHTDEGLYSAGHCARVPHNLTQVHQNHSRHGLVSSRYSISSDGFRPSPTQGARVLYSTPSDRPSQEMAPCHTSQPNHTSYGYTYQAPNPVATLYDSFNPTESWQPHRMDRGCSWPSASHGSGRMITIDNSKMDSYPSSSSPHTSLSLSGSTNTNGNATSPYQYQLLTTAFNPNPNTVIACSSSPSPVLTSHQCEIPPHGGREYLNRSYAPSTINSASYSGNPKIPYSQPYSMSRNVSLPDVSSNHLTMQSSEMKSPHGYGPGNRFF